MFDRYAIATVMILPIGLAHSGNALFAPPIQLLAPLVGLLSSAVPFYLEVIALTRMPARVYGTLTSLKPALGAVKRGANANFTLPLLFGNACSSFGPVPTAMPQYRPQQSLTRS